MLQDQHPIHYRCITTIEPVNRDGKSFITKAATRYADTQLNGDQGQPAVAEDLKSDPFNYQGSHSAIRSSGIDTDYSEPHWWTNVEPSKLGLPIMTWHNLITTQFNSKLPGGHNIAPYRNPLKVGQVIPGTNADLLMANPLAVLLNRSNSYKPLLLEEPTLEELEAISPIFTG